MATAPLNFAVFDRKDWQQLTSKYVAPDSLKMTPQILQNIKAYNDRIAVDDVFDVYGPLVSYIKLRYDQYHRDINERADFLGRPAAPGPFIIGIAGSVAVGKSTTARLLRYLLQVAFPKKQVALTTTDGFLLPNDKLRQMGIFDRKGFPESYDMTALLSFMNDLKEGKSQVQSPKYSHDQSDVLVGEYDVFENPDIFIIEGINTLQASAATPVYISDFFDLSIYVDAKTEWIEDWYIDRFKALLAAAVAAGDDNNFFAAYTKMPTDEAVLAATKVWRDVNLPNLNEFILPTRERADLVLHKQENHEIDTIWLRKF
ncbi:type I pantothenate kinase [Weissella bombi]|uniref:Pantothenate kinase n=1 Tax=Weissella bombi TaxID=1505725 RepID=A0A1C3ZBP5_9LACO|nr:type I pantothenate kinase [Weissella bombi]SCB79706.1 pantothenate kinase [Weissella bombi]